MRFSNSPHSALGNGPVHQHGQPSVQPPHAVLRHCLLHAVLNAVVFLHAALNKKKNNKLKNNNNNLNKTKSQSDLKPHTEQILPVPVPSERNKENVYSAKHMKYNIKNNLLIIISMPYFIKSQIGFYRVYAKNICYMY